MFHMPDGGVKKNGVVVVSDCLFYCFIDGLLHQRIVVAVVELSYDKSAEVRQDTAHSQVSHHSVNMVMTLSDIFDEKDREEVTLFAEAEGCALQAIKDGEVSADDRSASMTWCVERMSIPGVLHGFTGKELAQGLYGFAVFRQGSDMLAHNTVDRRLPTNCCELVQFGDVAEANDEFCDGRDAIDDPL